MKFLARILLCLLAALLLGGMAFMVVATFGPLLFPQPLSGSSAGEDIVIFAMPLATLAFGIGGFLLAWKLTKRLADRPTTLGL